MTAEPLVRVEDLHRTFPVGGGFFGRRGVVHAVSGVDLDVRPGEVLAVVGESGSGKTTLGSCMLGMLEPTAGRVVYRGQDVHAAGRSEQREFRRRVQPIFQDPYSSLDPRWPVLRSVREPLDAYGVGRPDERDAHALELLSSVGISEQITRRRPAQLSGGQRQRVAIAAALALEPELLVADEPVSALDVLVQAQILNLLSGLQQRLGLALVFITHDLSVVEHLADRIAVMYLGRIVETGEAHEVLDTPRHPYTRALLEAVPRIDSRTALFVQARGEIPSPVSPPPGCRFHTRCPLVEDVCRVERPPMSDFGDRHLAACHVEARAAGAPAGEPTLITPTPERRH